MFWMADAVSGWKQVGSACCPVEKANVMEDKLCVILLDKDHILPSIQPPTDEDYWIRKPSEPEFLACANEFWWCLNNVAKGLWREEIPYVHAMYTEGSQRPAS